MVGLTVRNRSVAAALAGLAFAGVSLHGASAETRSYVVTWFTQAAYSQDGDCPGGINPDIDASYRKIMAEFGKTPAEINVLIDALNMMGGNTVDPAKSVEAMDLVVNRGRIDGKPVNAYTNPAAVKDPDLKAVIGKYGFGFNLDGKGAQSPGGFEDPQTHEQGINNQEFRALGCFASLRGDLKNRPTQWAWTWDQLRNNMQAWLITISGADLSKDGDATITFDRALEHVTRDANGDVQADMTYRIDPDARSHNVFPAKVKDGVLAINEAHDFRMVGDPLLFPELNLKKAKLRLAMKPDGTLDGFVGGYQPWKAIYFTFGQGDYSEEANLGFDLSGIYHLLRKLADADPDPVTGQNRSISAAYRIEATRAFAVPLAGGNKTAQAGN